MTRTGYLEQLRTRAAALGYMLHQGGGGFTLQAFKGTEAYTWGTAADVERFLEELEETAD